MAVFAIERVLKKRAAHNHLSRRTLVSGVADGLLFEVVTGVCFRVPVRLLANWQNVGEIFNLWKFGERQIGPLAIRFLDGI